eukprot:GHVH01010623.1.p1 GENE.GHVH01010623.1~~GHVH01010623.1.p1  ORF type:complete len:1125 (+),score=170.27 GHVH01010623.1:360-3734(+)
MVSSTSSSDRDYYYIEDEVSVGQIEKYLDNPQVVEIRRLGHNGHYKGGAVKEKRVKSKKNKSSKSTKEHTTTTTTKDHGEKKNCKTCCIIGWLLSLVFLGLFIGFLVAYLNDKSELDDETTTSTSTSSTSTMLFPDWPPAASVFDSRDPAVVEKENTFIQNILDNLSLEEKVAQMIQPALNQSNSETATFKFGPGDQLKYGLGSMLNGGGGWPDEAMSYIDLDTTAKFPCPGCDGHSSNPRAYARLFEQFHVANETYWKNRTKAGAGAAIRIPWMYASDAVHGHNNAFGATLFPHNVGLGAMNDPDMMVSIGRVTAEEVAATGIDWTFAPAVSVPRFDTWGRTYEGYSEDSNRVYDYAGKMVEGIQGSPEDLTGDTYIISNIKHFLGDGGTKNGVDRGVNMYSEEDLINVHGQGYFSGLAAGAQVVMVSFNSWTNTANYDPVSDDGIDYNGKLHGSQYILTDVLKDKMGFDGIVVTDWLGHTEINGCSPDYCPQMINAGVDVVMLPGSLTWKDFMTTTIAQVNSEVIPQERIDDAVKRILRVKYRAGLWNMDSPLGIACHNPGADGVCGTSCDYKVAKGIADDWEVSPSADGTPCGRSLAASLDVLGSEDHMETARTAVSKSLVLMKNDGSVLPIPTDTDMKVGIDGSASKDWSKINGGWTLSWQGGSTDGIDTSIGSSDFPNAIHVTTAIKTVLGGADATITVVDDCTADDLDYCILMIGEDPYAEMVGDVNRSNNMEFKSLKPSYAADSELVADVRLAANSNGKTKIVTLFFSGRALYVNEEMNASDAFVVAWLPGSAGNGVSDVLFGDQDFTGSLPRTWPTMKCHWNVSSTPSNLDEGWMCPHFERSYKDIEDSGESAPFPLGYGLNYADPADNLEPLNLDDRSYGCLVPDPKTSIAPTTAYELTTGADMLCSVYKNQFDGEFQQIDCKCFDTTNDDSCPDDTRDGNLTAAVDAGKLTMTTVIGSDKALSSQVFYRLPETADVSAYFIDGGYLSMKVTQTAKLTADYTLGVGFSFGDGTAAFEMSDRLFYDISAEYNALVANTGTQLCMPLACFNGSSMSRDWYELSQSIIVETRGAMTMVLEDVKLQPSAVACTGTAVSCDSSKLYPSYSDWVKRVDGSA